MAYGDLCSELSGNLPGLSGFLAENWIQRAYRKIRDARLWSFLISDGSIDCPPAVTTGTFAITENSPTVVADPLAAAALLGLTVSDLRSLQIRFTGAGSTNQIYRIVHVVSVPSPPALTLTLDRPVEEVTSAVSPYMAYRCYVYPFVLAPDFLRWLSVVDMRQGRTLHLDDTAWGLDAIDPERQSFGDPTTIASYQHQQLNPEDPNFATRPVYELWPHPTGGTFLYARYRRRGLDLTNPDDVPNQMIPDDLILQAALGFYAYPWCMSNPGHFPALLRVNWAQLIVDAKREYFRMLIDAKRQDDNQMMQSVWNRGHGLRDSGHDGAAPAYPIDADFIQHHLVRL